MTDLKRPTRRAALAGSAALAALPFGAGGQAAPTLKGATVTFASWGGAYQDAQRVGYCDPFERTTGAKVVQEGPMSVARLRTMVSSGMPEWDVADVAGGPLEVGIKDNLFERIDTGIVGTGRIDPRFVSEHGVGCIVWSYNLAWNTTVFAGDTAPRTWADLFDLRKFPGKRSLFDQPVSSLEIALLADGVAPDALYPLDVDRAFRKLDTIKARSIVWTTSSQSQQPFVEREVALGVLPNGRAYDAVQKGAKVAISWEQNIQAVDYLVVPRGSRNRTAAMHLIDTMTLPENQARVANLIAYSPTNPEAFKGIDAKVEPWLCTSTENRRKGFVMSQPYWRDHLGPLTERWRAWRLSS